MQCCSCALLQAVVIEKRDPPPIDGQPRRDRDVVDDEMIARRRWQISEETQSVRGRRAFAVERELSLPRFRGHLN